MFHARSHSSSSNPNTVLHTAGSRSSKQNARGDDRIGSMLVWRVVEDVTLRLSVVPLYVLQVVSGGELSLVLIVVNLRAESRANTRACFPRTQRRTSVSDDTWEIAPRGRRAFTQGAASSVLVVAESYLLSTLPISRRSCSERSHTLSPFASPGRSWHEWQ